MLKILALVAKNGRITWSELASALGVSPPAAAERIKKLEERGIIKGYNSVIDWETLGYKLLAFIFVVLEGPKSIPGFLSLVNSCANILECHHIAGEYDYLLKVRCKDTKELDLLLSKKIKGLNGVARTLTNIVLSSQKETHMLMSFNCD